MSLIPSIFKAYDIRGLSPGEIDEAGVDRVSRALCQIYKPKTIVIGRDMRATSPILTNALVEAFRSSGVSIVDIGLCSTPVFNFAMGEGGSKYDLGVMITASHNPAKYNGLKLVEAGPLPIGQGSGMEELRDLACSAAVFETSSTRGEYTQDEGAIKRYIDRVLERADLPKDLPPVRLAIDAGNGMSGHVLPELFRRLPSIDVAKLYWELDGTFPHHEANPIKPENVKDLQALVRQDSFLFGVVPDGDSDRIGFVDETGEQIPGDILTALFAQEILATHPGGRVLFDIRSSWSVPEVILEAGGVPEMCRPGHALIKRHMHETGAVFAGELAMHYFFIDFWNCEASELALLLLLRRVIREEKPLSQIWKPLQRYVHSGEINFTVASPVDAVKKIADQYRAEATTISEIDGVRLEFRSKENPAGDWWFNVRPSNTEPVLRLNLEARTKEEMEKRREELTKKILEIK